MAKKKTKKKEIKTVKRRLKLSGVLILALVLYLSYLGVKELVKIDVSSITVMGNDYLSDSAIIKDAGLNSNTSYLGFSSKGICNTLTDNPLIRSCRIKRGLDFKITLEIVENKPLFFYSHINSVALSNGIMVSGNNPYGVPTLINYVPEKILNKFIDGLSLVKSDIIRSISEIEYSPSSNSEGTYIDDSRFILTMNDGNTVYVNNRHIDVLSYYEKVYASIGDKKGTLYFDCDYDNYYFDEYSEE